MIFNREEKKKVKEIKREEEKKEEEIKTCKEKYSIIYATRSDTKRGNKVSVWSYWVILYQQNNATEGALT